MESVSFLQQLIDSIHWWDFVAGLGLFLFGMLQIEDAIHRLAGNRIKRFLREHTDQSLRSIGSGMLATAVLQSSSLVALLTLAMVGAQILALSNALGVIIGANLGTTITGWFIASVGFKLDLQSFALPLIALGSIGLVISNTEKPVAGYLRFITGFGLLLFGLEFMKSSVPTEGLALSGVTAPWVFLGLGIVVTAIIQSSSAAMIIALAALNADALALSDAAAFIIGADLGTTSTVMLGALKGSANKRRVGLAHFLFNLVTDAMAFFVLLPFIPKLEKLLAFDEPIYLLVGFHSTFNLIGIILFYPLLGPFARFLERLFVDKPEGLAQSLGPTVAADINSALAAMSTEVRQLAQRVQRFSRGVVKSQTGSDDETLRREYHQIKVLEGELLEFGLGLQKQEFSEEESRRLEALIGAARDLVHSAKSVKDSGKDLHDLQESLASPERALYSEMAEVFILFFERTQHILEPGDTTPMFEDLGELHALNQEHHDTIHRLIFEQLKVGSLDWPTVSSSLNANRELFISNSDFIRAVGKLLLDPAQFEDLETLPIGVGG